MSCTMNRCIGSADNRLPPGLPRCCSILGNATGRSTSDYSWHTDSSSQFIRPGDSQCSADICNLPPGCCNVESIPSCCTAGIIYDSATSPCITDKVHQPHSNILDSNQFYEYSTPMDHFNTHYEYQEPEENFISIDDAKIKGFLTKIGREQAKSKEQRDIQANDSNLGEQRKPIFFEVIELGDEEERRKLNRIKESVEKESSMKSNLSKPDVSSTDPLKVKLNVSSNCKGQMPSISLIPKNQKIECKSQENIIASIDLVESSSDSEYGDVDDDVLPLVATAVSCELQSDEEGYDDQLFSNDDDVINVSEISNYKNHESRWKDSTEAKTRGPFECTICQKTVQSNYNLRRHMMIHTGEKPYACDLCEKRFREYSDLKKHRRRHFNENNFFCMICKINRPLETDSTRCGSCDTRNGAVIAAMYPQSEKSIEEEKSPALMKISPSNHTTTTISTCDQSYRESNSPANIPPPLTPIVSISTDADVYTDNIVSSMTINECTLQSAAAGTTKGFSCPLCQRSFGTRHNLKRHFMIHTGEKPFSCTSCRKPFREYSTLKKHMVTHLRDKWYKCFHCPKKFRDYLNYMEHKSTHPLEEADDDECIECCECGRKYTDIETYSEHLKEHDPAVFICECYICKKSFPDVDTLNQHMSSRHAIVHKSYADDDHDIVVLPNLVSP